jgi:hypothetical protein
MPTSRSVAIRIEPPSGSATSLTFWRIGFGLRAGTTPPDHPERGEQSVAVAQGLHASPPPWLRRRPGPTPGRLDPSRAGGPPPASLSGRIEEGKPYRNRRRRAASRRGQSRKRRNKAMIAKDLIGYNRACPRGKTRRQLRRASRHAPPRRPRPGASRARRRRRPPAPCARARPTIDRFSPARVDGARAIRRAPPRQALLTPRPGDRSPCGPAEPATPREPAPPGSAPVARAIPRVPGSPIRERRLPGLTQEELRNQEDRVGAGGPYANRAAYDPARGSLTPFPRPWPFSRGGIR